MRKNKSGEEKSVYSIIFDTYRIFMTNITSKWIVMVALSLIPALVSPFKIYLEKSIYDNAAVAYGQGILPEKTTRIFAIAFLVQIIYIAGYSVYRSSINYIGSELEIILQNNINRKTSKLNLTDFEDSTLYKNIELACNVSRDLRFMIMMFTSEIFVYLITFLSVSGVLLSYHYSLILIGILAVLPDVFTKIIQAKYQYAALSKLQEYTRSKTYFENVLCALEFNKEIRAYHTKKYFTIKWDSKKELYNHEKEKVIGKDCKTNLICGAVSWMTAMVSVIMPVLLLYFGEISIGEFASSLSAVILLKSNFLRILNLGLFSFQCGLKGKHYYSVMDYMERNGEEKDVDPSEGIELEQVSFSYAAGKNVVRDMSVKLKPHQTVAVVGKNGAGKSTLSKLLLGLYSPASGRVLYGDKDIRNIEEECIYRHSSAVFQNFCKYYFTVRDNVTISSCTEQVDDEKIEKLLTNLELKIGGEPIRENQLETGLGVEFDGQELSGGNWQKLAIARGMYRPHRFIVFDEPTAALDPLIEEKIFTEMINNNRDNMKVFITHRMSTAASADVIIVIENGKIAEVGAHKELISKDGLYAELWKTQAEWYR